MKKGCAATSFSRGVITKKIIKKIVIHYARNAKQKCRINRWFLEYFVYMIARARYLPRKPRYRASLFLQLIANKMTNM